MTRFDVITLFPEMLDAVTRYGITGRACERKLAMVVAHQLRDYAHDAYKTIDDRPYGGGPGMVMMAGPLTEAVVAVKAQQQAAGYVPGPVILMSPSGRRIDQSMMDRLAQAQACWTLICGRYEGVDQRFIDQQVDECWSLGDFVLSGVKSQPWRYSMRQFVSCRGPWASRNRPSRSRFPCRGRAAAFWIGRITPGQRSLPAPRCRTCFVRPS